VIEEECREYHEFVSVRRGEEVEEKEEEEAQPTVNNTCSFQFLRAEEQRTNRESDKEGAEEATEDAEVGCVRRGGQGMGGGSGKRNEVGVPLACSLGLREKLEELDDQQDFASAAEAGDAERWDGGTAR
jgi:hypothetical protein